MRFGHFLFALVVYVQLFLDYVSVMTALMNIFPCGLMMKQCQFPTAYERSVCLFKLIQPCNVTGQIRDTTTLFEAVSIHFRNHQSFGIEVAFRRCSLLKSLQRVYPLKSYQNPIGEASCLPSIHPVLQGFQLAVKLREVYLFLCQPDFRSKAIDFFCRKLDIGRWQSKTEKNQLVGISHIDTP